jgi:hypothetical protein
VLYSIVLYCVCCGISTKHNSVDPDQLNSVVFHKILCSDADQLISLTVHKTLCSDADQLISLTVHKTLFSDADQLISLTLHKTLFSDADQLISLTVHKTLCSDDDQLISLTVHKTLCSDADQLISLTVLKTLCSDADQLISLTLHKTLCSDADQLISLTVHKTLCSDSDQLISHQSITYCISLLSLSRLKYWAVPAVDPATLDILQTTYVSHCKYRFIQKVGTAPFQHPVNESNIVSQTVATLLYILFMFRWHYVPLCCGPDRAWCVNLWLQMNRDFCWLGEPKCWERNLHCLEPVSAEWETGD